MKKRSTLKIKDDTAMRLRFFFLLIGVWLGLSAWAQTAMPTMTYVDADGATQTETSFAGSAPFTPTFKANIEGADGYTPRYEWQFYRNAETTPFLVRYDETTTYTFKESGSFSVKLLISFVQGNTTVEYEQDEVFTIAISESSLEFPNAFTPNGDGVNDVLQAKTGYKSITEFRAMVFSRSGKKIYEWTDPAQGWDGTSGGSPVPDGGYYLNVQAKGADGRVYDIKKVVSLLRKHYTQ